MGKEERGLIVFQNLNCLGCRFADELKVGTGDQCCNSSVQIKVAGGHCKTRRTAASSDKEGRIKN